ncbi:hypothetical protein ACFL1N_08800 [Thermodesulfobacteriota bacterium]
MIKILVTSLCLLSAVIFAKSAKAENIPIEVAKTAARDKLHLFFPGEWSYFDYFVLYNLADEPAAYAVIFSNQNTAKAKLADLEKPMDNIREHIKSHSSSIEKIISSHGKSGKAKNMEISKVQKEIDKLNNRLRHKDSYVTVITGAQDTLPVVLKCYRGLPNLFVKKKEAHNLINNKYPEREWHFQRYLYLGTFDESIQFIHTEKEYKNTEESSELVPFIVDLRSRSINRKDITLKEKGQLLENRKINNRKTSWEGQNIKQWERYRKKIDNKVPR